MPLGVFSPKYKLEVPKKGKSMEILEQKITIENSCNLIKKSKDIFAPVKEAITNSLDAIHQRQGIGDVFMPQITVSVHFATSRDAFEKKKYVLHFVSVEDNGIGFTVDNLARFKKLAEISKNLNNRGTGKIQIFCHFNKISIESIFHEAGKWHKLDASWRKTGEYYGSLVEMENANQINYKTVVKMSEFSGDKKEQEFFSKYIYDIDELRKDVLNRFLLRLWHGVKDDKLSLMIQTFVDENKGGEYTFNQSNMSASPKEERVHIYTEQASIRKDKKSVKIDWNPVEPPNELVIRRFSLKGKAIDEDSVYLCSKNIVVAPFKFSIVRKGASYNGSRYLTSISGALLDDPTNVNQAVDGFIFPSKKEIEAELKDGSISLFNQDNKFVFWDEIKEKVGQGLSRVYSDVEGLKEEREKRATELAKEYGISLEDAEATEVQIDDSDEALIKKLFKTQADRFAKQSIEIRKTYAELKELETPELDPTSEQYRTKFTELSNKLLKKIPEQNKDELARYVIRRDMVVDLLKFALDNKLAIQKEWAEKKANGEKAIRTDNEGIIHDLIFKRRTKGVPNDLWILNEEFVHFEGYSDIELNNLEINGEKLLRPDVDIENALKMIGIEFDSELMWRPDVFLYPEEGKCILVEFKAPNVELSRHCDQIQRYAKIIANYSIKKFTQFFGYLIGEQITQLSVPDRYKIAPYGNYWIYANEPINDIETGLQRASIYQEIIPLSEIANRAKIRNKSFADKLGITPNDIIEMQKKENLE